MIYEKETEYQCARVIQNTDAERRLELNEGHAVHSLYRPGTVLTNDYWDAVFPEVRRDPAMQANTILVGGRRLLGGRLETALAGGDAYTDDRAPVEWLIDRSLVEYAAGPSPNRRDSEAVTR